MKSFYTKGLLVLSLILITSKIKAQPYQYDFINSNTTDTIWLSRTNNEGHTSDYYIYFWFEFKNFLYAREYHRFYPTVICDGAKVEIDGGTVRELLSTPKSLGIGPLIKRNLTYFVRERDWNRCTHWYPPWSKYDCDVVNTDRLSKSTDTALYATIFPPKNLKATNEGKVQNFIVIQWEKGTDIPDNMHKYLIYKNGILIATKNGDVREYTDISKPGTWLYEVKNQWNGTDTSLVSESDSITASTFLLDFRYTPKNNKIEFLWNPLIYIPNNKTPSAVTIDGYRITRLDTSELSGTPITIMGKSDLTKDRPDGFDNTMEIPGYKYRYVLEPYPTGDYYADTVYACSLPDGGFEGRIVSLTGQGVPGVEVCAIRLDSVPQDTTTRYCSLTDQNGFFNIQQVYYYKGSEFMLQPSYKDHGFKISELSSYPGNKFRLENSSAFGGIIFVDTSTLLVHGKIIQAGLKKSCTLDLENIKVKMYRNKALVDEAFTNDSSIYTFNIDSGGVYSFVPELFNHKFTPDSISVAIFYDTTLITITDNTIHKLSGYVYGACKTYFGQAKIKIYEGKTDAESCIDTTISTNNLGYYEIFLPANKYTISVEDFISADITVENDVVLNYFTSEEADLTKDSLQFNFVYRNEPRLELTGFNNMGCGNYESIPIVKQDFTYPIQIKVYDMFGETTCPADTGSITIKDKTGYHDIDTTFALQNGQALYLLKPGFPNLIADYTKNITITASVEKENITVGKDILVEGAQPMENTFLTTSPEIPLFILHDPPGDNSYSYLQKESNSQIAIGNIQHETKSVDGFSNEWKVCPTAVFSYEAINWEFEVSAGWRRLRTVNVDLVKNKSTETIIEMDHKQGYQTSSDPELTSSTGGDVYIGGALNLIYAETKGIKFNYNTCQVDGDWDIYIMPHSLATDFIYSENHIRNYLVPEFDRLQKYYESLEDDTASFFEDQKNIWLTALANNQINLSDSSTFIKRISFDGGAGPINEETTNRSTIRNSYEFHSVFDTTVTHYWKAELAGVGFERSNVKSKIKIEVGQDSSNTSSNGTTTGYVLKDDNLGDKFMVNVYRDNVYGTPAFKLVSGNSSCPYETGSRPREGVQLTANKYVAIVDDPNGTAVFRLQLANVGQAGENREYNLYFHQGSNPDGAQLTLGGSQIQAGVPIPYTLPSWGFKEATVTVKRGPEAFDYHNLMFTLESGCNDNQVIDTLLLDVHFKSTCSDLFLINPTDNWVISSSDQGKLKTTLAGYNKDLLNDITIQICYENNYDTWFSLDYLTSNELGPEKTDVNLFLDQIGDGNYEIRARLECNSGKVYTKPIKGIKDSYGPQYFGVPEPADNILDSGDIISAVFDETINSQAFSSANIICTNETGKTNLSFNSGCNTNQISIFPDFPTELNPTDVYRVFVFGLEDMYGNRMNDTVTWAFTVSVKPEIPENEDTDMDGIINKDDNCPYTSNSKQEDTNMDGIGNACDIDIDGDGINNTEDNCPYHFNSDQSDLDEDNIGDLCDYDDDGDMVPDTVDTNPKVYNPNQVLGLSKYSGINHIVTLRPNPAKNVLYVEYTDRSIKKIEILNIYGEHLYMTTDINFPMNVISLSGYTSGVYFVRTTDNKGGVNTFKLIKE